MAQYGLAMGLGDAYGQTAWSLFACSTGWRFMDEPWGTEYHFDDERVIQSIQSLADLGLVDGFNTPEEEIASLNVETGFASGTAALIFHGSWMINWMADNITFPFGFGHLPTGPEGRICMFNGLADSIWTGSEHQAEAWNAASAVSAAAGIAGKITAVPPTICCASGGGGNRACGIPGEMARCRAVPRAGATGRRNVPVPDRRQCLRVHLDHDLRHAGCCAWRRSSRRSPA